MIFAGFRDQILNSRDPNQVRKTPLKNPAWIDRVRLHWLSQLFLWQRSEYTFINGQSFG